MRGGALGAVLAAVLGCGPSYEAIAEGDLRFAHCDRLDLDPKIAPSHRLHCWREWRRVYTYGQTRDRIEYAQRRIAEVVSGDPSPPFELPTSEPEEVLQRREPLRSRDARPEPRAAPGNGEAPVTPETLRQLLQDPGCRARCQAEHEACLPGCETRPTGCQPCEPSLRACLDECGKDASGTTAPAAPAAPSTPAR